MELSLRPYATAGIALVGASVIAVTPVTAMPDIHHIASPGVELSAAIDPITPVLDAFNSSEVNAAALVNEWLKAPLPVVQQVIANQLGNLTNHTDLVTALGNAGDNVKAALASLTSGIGSGANDADHEFVYPILTDGVAALGIPAILPAELQPLFALTTTYLSGALIGLVGPVIAPVLALAASTQAIVDNLTGATPDLSSAVNDLVNIPAKMTDAFLNGGQTLDLTPVVTALAPTLGLQLPEGTKMGLTLGGVLSPGGSIYNALGIDASVDVEVIPGYSIPFDVHVAGQPVGTIGSLIGLSKVVAKAFGWDGTGNPLAPPLPAAKTETTKANVELTSKEAVATDSPATVPSFVRGAKVPTLGLDAKTSFKRGFNKTDKADTAEKAQKTDTSATPAADAEKTADAPKHAAPRVKHHVPSVKKSAESTGKREHTSPKRSHEKHRAGKHSAA